MWKTVRLILVSIFLVGCAIRPQSDFSPTYQQESFASTSVTPTFTVVETPSFESLIVPTQTALSLSVTMEAMSESCGGDVDNEYILSNKKAYSSNAQWTATVCQNLEIYTKVSDLDGKYIWKLPVIDNDEIIPGPEWYLQPFQWSKDSQYLFLVPKPFGSIDGPGLAFADGFGLFRLNLSTGHLESWFSPDVFGYAFSFSPNERLFVFTDPDNQQLVRIHDIVSGDERIIQFKERYTSIGQFVWVLDSSELIIVAGVDGWISGAEGFSLFLYDLNSSTLTTLIDNDKRQLSPATGYFDEVVIDSPWLSNDILLLDNPLYSNDAWTLNIRSQELLPYPTPIVTPTYDS